MRSGPPGIFPFRIDPEDKVDMNELLEKWFSKEK